MILTQDDSHTPSFMIEDLIVEVPVDRLLAYLRLDQSHFHVQKELWERGKTGIDEVIATNALHINLGTPGIEEPDYKVEENPEILYWTLRRNRPSIPVLFSGDWKRAVDAGLLSMDTYEYILLLLREPEAPQHPIQECA